MLIDVDDGSGIAPLPGSIEFEAAIADAYARPIVEELRAHTYDLSSLQQLATGGAAGATVLSEDRSRLFCEGIARHPSGKADYRWAKEAALEAVSVDE